MRRENWLLRKEESVNRHLRSKVVASLGTAASSREDRSMLVPESRSSAWNGVLDVEIECHHASNLLTLHDYKLHLQVERDRFLRF